MSFQPTRRVTFRPRARLIRTIGDRLVSGPIAAIGELVKNGFDADANEVTIRFVAKNGYIHRIEICDSGHGMPLDTILTKWMEPATESKVLNRRSKNGRNMLGSKGIGRFAAARLGRNMLMISTAIQDDMLTTTAVRIDWSKFDHGEYLDEVGISTKTQVESQCRVGTLIRVTNVPNEWGERQFLELLNELRKFMSPFPGESKAKNFSIFLDLTNCPKEIVGRDIWALCTEASGVASPIKIKPLPIFSTPDYEVLGEFDRSGEFKGSMTFHGLSKNSKEEISFKKSISSDSGEAPCGKVRIRLLIFDRDPNSIDALIKRANLKGIGKREARNILDNLCGVGIYRFGFRIRPYGDSDQDWLELDRRRIDEPSIKIGHNQIIGLIEVEDESKSNLIERSSREGLEDNGSYYRLKNQILSLLATGIEPLRRKARIASGIGTKKPTSYTSVFSSADFKWADPIVAALPARKRSAARETIEKASKRLQQQLNDLQQRQIKLEANSTLGQIVAEVIHSGRQPASAIGFHTSDVLAAWPLIVPEVNRQNKAALDAKESLELVLSESKKLERLFKQLTPLSGRRRGRPTKNHALPIVENVLALYKDRMIEARISTEVHINSDHHFIGYADDLSISIANLVENSIYWLIDSGIGSPRIKITSSIDYDEMSIEFEDNGPGIDPRLEDHLFEPGFSTRNGGTGLGLSISRESLARSNGSIDLIETDKGCIFRITFLVKDR